MIEWLLILITILLSGFFSGTEIAYTSSNRLKLEIKSRRDVFGARSLAHFLRNPEELLSTTHIGNSIAVVTYATMLTLFMPETSVLVKMAVASLIIILFGEIIPKAIFRTHPDGLIAMVAGPMRVISLILKPIVTLSTATSEWFNRRLQFNIVVEPIPDGRSDIETLIREIGDHSGSELDKDDSEILSNMLELSNIRVKESMIPRTEIVAIERSATLDEARQAFISSGFSKLPVYEETIDNVIGVVVAYDLFNKPKTLEAIVRPIKHVAATHRSKDLLAEFRKQKLNMAIVIDEYGGTAGIITIEDLLEEVIGDIQDEYDEEDTIIKQISESCWMLSGNVEIEELVDAYPQLRIPTKDVDYETVAGFVMHETGRIPIPTEEVVIGSMRLTITKGTRSRIELVKLQLLD